MRVPYLVASVNGSDASGWFVIRSDEGRVVAKGLTKAQAITLASVLNLTANALRVAWWEARKPPQS